MGKHLGIKKIPVDSKEHKRYVRKLADDINKTKGSFRDYVNRNAAFDDENMTTHIDFANRLYTRMILANVLRPLTAGINKESIKQTLLTYAGVCLTNKSFSKDVRAMGKEFMNMFRDAKSDRKAEKIQQKFDSSEKYQKKVQHLDDYPITAAGAAHMHIAWTTDAFNKMREDGADVDQIMSDYNKAVDMLHKRCERYGVSIDEVNEQYRAAVTDLVRGDPHNATYFEQLSIGGVSSDYLTQSDGEKADYTDNDSGEKFTSYFTPRLPFDDTDHYQFYANLVTPLSETKDWHEVFAYVHKMDKYADFLEVMRGQDGVEMTDAQKSSVIRNVLPDWAKQKQTQEQQDLFIHLLDKYKAKSRDRAAERESVRTKKATSKYNNRENMYSEDRRRYYEGSSGYMHENKVDRRMPDSYDDGYEDQADDGLDY